LSVAGTSREAAVELVRRLEKSPHFSQAQVQSEAMSQASQTNRDTIKFEISAIYLPAFARQKAAQQEQQTGAETEARNARH
jgi:hypothetical protein